MYENLEFAHNSPPKSDKDDKDEDKDDADDDDDKGEKDDDKYNPSV